MVLEKKSKPPTAECLEAWSSLLSHSPLLCSERGPTWAGVRLEGNGVVGWASSTERHWLGCPLQQTQPTAAQAGSHGPSPLHPQVACSSKVASGANRSGRFLQGQDVLLGAAFVSPLLSPLSGLPPLALLSSPLQQGLDPALAGHK